MNFHQGTADAPRRVARAPLRSCHHALLRAFVPDIGEKLGFRGARERKSVSHRGQSAQRRWGWRRSRCVVRGERSEVVSGTTRRSFYINFGNLSQERS